MPDNGFETVVLAGGLGTRLRSVISDLPKPMAPVNGKPFLHYVLEFCQRQKVGHAVLSVGYKGGLIREHFGTLFDTVEGEQPIKLSYSFETVPLGTGGGIRLAMEKITGDTFFILNGDTYFDIDLKALNEFHHNHQGSATLALKEMTDFDRYGTVETEGERIVSFREKCRCAQGLINGGIYCLQKSLLLPREPGSIFSFERDVLEARVGQTMILGLPFTGYFIDIGIPEDYTKASAVFGL